MTRTPLLIAVAAVAALAGCNKENHTIIAGGEPSGDNLAANAQVVLPPTIAASKIYRCADNTIVHVDWLSDEKSANVRLDKSTAPTHVAAPEAGKPMVGPAGYSVEGSSKASSVKIAVPGHPAQSCKA